MNKTLRKQLLNALYDLQAYQNDAGPNHDHDGMYSADEKRAHRREQSKICKLIDKVTSL